MELGLVSVSYIWGCHSRYGSSAFLHNSLTLIISIQKSHSQKTVPDSTQINAMHATHRILLGH